MTNPYLHSIEEVSVRDAGESDMFEVSAIYAHFVTSGLATFEESPPDFPEMCRRLASIRECKAPYLVAETAGKIVGYCYAAPYRPRPAYRFTIEDSVYVDKDWSGNGIGELLLRHLIDQAEKGPWRQMIAVIGHSENSGSIALHRKLGFEHTGTFTGVGFKLGQWVDTVLMQRAIGPGCTAPPGGILGFHK
ncbi:GNAT family N-acetyltransferase [Rhizobium sp. BK008]|jgi:L-amino acid N-acyltransferase YncA|uniref:GNAT family N-acetyltransferase n=1 Tax=Rhizobium sp. BK008 TaxID=2587094 RepID=UPI00160F8C63|nr:GNAT family N-acetyltransferase [Rhizobium sp. BK008]MBB4255723.1 phosphinothricin acetyltransferase [Rhizobium sp. BK008]